MLLKNLLFLMVVFRVVFWKKNMSWITLFIAMAPSLGFLGTVVGMIMAFDKIEPGW